LTYSVPLEVAVQVIRDESSPVARLSFAVSTVTPSLARSCSEVLALDHRFSVSMV
jgi:hypothetical protein